MSDAQSRWENQRDIDCAEHNQPQCPKFPDHDCPECHNQHVEDHEPNKWCDVCADQKCEKCNGKGYYMTGTKTSPDGDETECEKCEATGGLKTIEPYEPDYDDQED